MKVVKNVHFADFDCPHCYAHLSVDDPEDLEDHLGHRFGRLMPREEGYWDECPECGEDIYVHINWEPEFSAHENEC